MDIVKSFIKRYLPSNLKIIAVYLLNKQVNPYSLKSELFLPECISDFFVWSHEFNSIYFIAENTNALINGKEEEISHVFSFYSPYGDYLGEHEYTTKEFIARIKLHLDFEANEYKYISFTHITYSKISLQETLEKKGIEPNLKISNQNRGYTIYYPEKNKTGCAVHGNFGGIASNNNKTAKQRASFIYTPTYRFDKSATYHLVFNNPTDKKLEIRIYTLTDREIKIISLSTMGSDFIELKDFSGGISIESKLPICRPVIFKNPPPNTKGFDVFHS